MMPHNNDGGQEIPEIIDYKVKEGDTLFGISLQFDCNLWKMK